MITSECKTVGIHHDSLTHAVSRDYDQFYMKEVTVKDKKRFTYDDSKQDPPQEDESLQAKVIDLQHLFRIQNGYTPVLDCHTSHNAFKFKEIPNQID
ncbi:MAG: putative eukaryotic translation elongation factor 1 alpha 2 [Streblomastix strix]|uniref:Putative eukaryotic translation elongation factor 1 alpha 2 n=1 Tax=Streblomastix strix TaxID=222440 RepID=A0A5J4W8K6_9EUKA|nr:MAG: putative eukaryotic translation elongation factor 1 alpha 2 [Streblomastix strix]